VRRRCSGLDLARILELALFLSTATLIQQEEVL